MSNLWVVAARTPQRFFHGGRDGLKPGDVLRPGSEIGKKNHPLSERGQVYVHPDPGIARVFAQDFHGDQAKVYEVRPVSPTPDMPHDPWNSQHTTSEATVLSTVPDHEVTRMTDHLDEHGYL